MTEERYQFSDFKPDRILSNNTNRKIITVVGKFPSLSTEHQAIILLEKSAFTEENTAPGGIFTEDTRLKEEFVNDIYGNFLCYPKPDLNSIKVSVIYPATEKHLIKYSIQDLYIIEETPALYENITLPHLEREKFSLQWVYNILEHKQETERIVFEDPDPKTGFVLLPDLKWDGKTVETLYLLAVCFDRSIKSLRDLGQGHLDLLRNIKTKGCQTIEDKYGIKSSQLRIYVHYQPSFYHFHVHFTFLKHDAPGIFCEKSHLLTGIINNIELVGDYYQKATLSFTVRAADRLFERYNEELSIKKFTAQLPTVDTIGVLINDGDFVVRIEHEEHHVVFGHHFALKPQTLSSVSVGGGFLSFRVNTNPSNVSAVKPQHSRTNFNLVVNLKPTEDYRILCAQCEGDLGAGRFGRILELPSDSLDMSEWFCCSHKHSDQPAFPGVEDKGKEKSNANRFSPKADELLYGNFYALFNRSVLEGAVHEDNAVACKGCGHVLGEVVRRTNALKIWNENIKFVDGSANILRLFDCENLFENFMVIVQKCLAFETQMGMPGPSRLLVEAKTLSGTSKFLFLQIMDRNLQVFQSQGDELELKPITMVKVMFKLLAPDDELLKVWQNDNTVNELQISSTMLEAALDKLTDNAAMIPESCRFFDGFTITYLNLM